MNQALTDLEQSLRTTYPGGVPRNKIGQATGGILNPGTCRNEDCIGCGIQGRFRVGRNTIYPITGIITRIREKALVSNLMQKPVIDRAE